MKYLDHETIIMHWSNQKEGTLLNGLKTKGLYKKLIKVAELRVFLNLPSQLLIIDYNE